MYIYFGLIKDMENYQFIHEHFTHGALSPIIDQRNGLEMISMHILNVSIMGLGFHLDQKTRMAKIVIQKPYKIQNDITPFWTDFTPPAKGIASEQ